MEIFTLLLNDEEKLESFEWLMYNILKLVFQELTDNFSLTRNTSSVMLDF